MAIRALTTSDAYGLAVFNVRFCGAPAHRFYVFSAMGLFCVVLPAADAIGFSCALRRSASTAACFSRPHAQLLRCSRSARFSKSLAFLVAAASISRCACSAASRFAFSSALARDPFFGQCAGVRFCFLRPVLQVESVIHQQGHFRGQTQYEQPAADRTLHSWPALLACSAFMASSVLMRSCSASHSVSAGDALHLQRIKTLTNNAAAFVRSALAEFSAQRPCLYLRCRCRF